MKKTTITFENGKYTSSTGNTVEEILRKVKRGLSDNILGNETAKLQIKVIINVKI